ncbi:MAG: hypothetical protein OXT51_09890 [Chloroflexota bacterium]|nr:hypothetical protein [Chloroflexota bacterium]
MAVSEVAEFVGASAGFAIAAVGIVVAVVGFFALARMGNRARPSPGKK